MNYLYFSSRFTDYGKNIYISSVYKLIKLGFHYKLYLFGIAVLLVSSMFFKEQPSAMAVAFTVGTLSFAAGFLTWCWPLIGYIWSKDVGKVGLGVLNFFVLLITTVLARYFVAKSLQLPPQDFDLTVSFCIFFLYVPCLALVLAAISSVAVIGIFLWNVLMLVFERKLDEKLWLHCIGSLAFCSYCWAAFHFTNEHANSVKPAIRFIAWVADFQPAAGYPGVKADERVRLLENGVVSAATLKGFDVSISLR